MFSGKRMWQSGQWFGFIAAGLLLTGLAGCGAVDPWDEIPVSGKVTYDDGSVIKATRLRVMFKSKTEPVDKKHHPRPGWAEVSLADGTFSEVTTSVAGDGLIPGRHEVIVHHEDDAKRRDKQTLMEIVKITSFDPEGTPTELKVPPYEIEVGPDAIKFEFQVKK